MAQGERAEEIRNKPPAGTTLSPCASVWKIKKISKGKPPLPKSCSLAAMTTISLR